MEKYKENLRIRYKKFKQIIDAFIGSKLGIVSLFMLANIIYIMIRLLDKDTITLHDLVDWVYFYGLYMIYSRLGELTKEIYNIKEEGKAHAAKDERSSKSLEHYKTEVAKLLGNFEARIEKAELEIQKIKHKEDGQN